MQQRIRLEVAYEGTDFCGWALQRRVRTVQGTLQNALACVIKSKTLVIGASRTDSGVHAKSQVCHFDTDSSIPPERWAPILNDQLPSDLRVLSSYQVSNDFHSRFWADKRIYRYRILLGKQDPFRARFTYEYSLQKNLELDLMRAAAQHLIGKHDFRAFGKELAGVNNTIRILHGIQIRKVVDEVWIDVVGTAFIRGMMRKIAGLLLQVGSGKRPACDAIKLLRSEKYSKIELPPVLPASGLILLKILYGRHPKDIRERIAHCARFSLDSKDSE